MATLYELFTLIIYCEVVLPIDAVSCIVSILFYVDIRGHKPKKKCLQKT